MYAHAISVIKKISFVESFMMNTGWQFSKIILKINKTASIATMIRSVLTNSTALAEAIWQGI